MPKVDLSDEQVQELCNLLADHIDRLEAKLRTLDAECDRDRMDPDVLATRHELTDMSAILEVLEDA